MVNNSNISYTQNTLNVAVGCDKQGEDCRNCYACLDACRRADNPKFPLYESVITREPNIWGKNQDWTGRVNFSFDKLKEIDRIASGNICFLNTMSDSFHKELPEDFIRAMFASMNARQDVIFLVLTKRARRLAELAPSLTWTPNIWIGVTVGVENSLWRLKYLRQVPARVRWVSAEPLLEPLDFSPWLEDGTLNWVVVGGESKSGWRPMEADWVRTIRDHCQRFQVPFFFKQEAGYAPAKHPMLDGRVWEEWPVR